MTFRPGESHDAAASAAFARRLTRTLRRDIPVRLALHIDDPAFAEHCCELLRGFLAGLRAFA